MIIYYYNSFIYLIKNLLDFGEGGFLFTNRANYQASLQSLSDA